MAFDILKIGQSIKEIFKIINDNFKNAINTSEKGTPDGVATLDNDGQVPSSQLPRIASTAAEVDMTGYVKPSDTSAIDGDDTVDSAIGKLEYKTDDTIVRVDDVEDSVGDIETKVSGLKTDIEDNGIKISELQTDVGNTEADISDLRNNLTEINMDISEIESGISNIESEITTTKSQIVDLDNDINTNKTAIGELNDEVNLQSTAIAALESNMTDVADDISNIVNDISGLDTRVTTLEQSGEGTDYAKVANTLINTTAIAKSHIITDMSPIYQKFREFAIYGESSGTAITDPAIFVHGSKNVFDYQVAYDIAYSLYPSRVSMTTKDGRRCIYFSRTISAPNNPFPIKFKPNTQYTISFDFYHDTSLASGGGEGFRVLYTDGSSTYVIPSYVYNTWSTRTATTQAGRTVSEISWSFNTDMPTYLDVDTIQVEEGTVATGFEAYDGKLITLTGLTLNQADTVTVSDGIVTLTQSGVATNITATVSGQALLSLHGYSPNTSIVSDADCAVKYNVDTQKAFDDMRSQLDALINAVNGG